MFLSVELGAETKVPSLLKAQGVLHIYTGNRVPPPQKRGHISAHAMYRFRKELDEE